LPNWKIPYANQALVFWISIEPAPVDHYSPTQVKCLFVPTGRKAFKCGQQKSEYFRIDQGDKEREHIG
jgi:hypothetical protein